MSIRKPETPPMGFQLQVYNALEDLPNKVEFPDKSNIGRLAAMLMLWKRVADMADKKAEALQKLMIADGQMTDPKTITIPGDHVLGGGGAMTINCKVSQARREFNMDWFASKLLKEYKVPIAQTKAIFEQAKQPGTSHTRTITVSEKGISI